MKVYFVNSIISSKEISNRINGELCFILLKHDTCGYEIKKTLSQHPDSKEIEISDFISDFGSKFIDLMSELNSKNNSLHWWALNLTNKNPISSDLCNNAFKFVALVNLLKKNKINNLIVITDDSSFGTQLQVWAKDKEIEVINKVTRVIDFKKIAKRLTPAAIFFAFVRTVAFKLISYMFVRFRIDKKAKYNVLMSLVNHQSFTKDGKFRDAYFGELTRYFKNNDINFIILGNILFPPYVNVLKKTAARIKDFLFVPIEYTISLIDLFNCFIVSVYRFFVPIRIKGVAVIDGIDVSYLAKLAAREDRHSTKFFSNLVFYYSVKKLSKKINIKKLFYPFENRSFEKMIILALRNFSSESRIIGYQHASISRRHTNFFLGREEEKITPLPNRIVTIGEITKDILKTSGGFPEKLLTVGCALRQQHYNGSRKPRKKKINNLFVALATNLEEYVKVLNFLNIALKERTDYKIWIRPHPVFSLEEAINILGGTLSFEFHKAYKEALSECYDWADLVLYVHSTLSLEALSRGIPVVNIKISDCLDADPLFNFSDFKWRIKDPGILIETIKKIDAIPDLEYSQRQEKAIEYAKKYMYPATESNMKVFLDA